MNRRELDRSRLEDLFNRRLLSRREFAAALAGIGVAAAGIEGLLDADAAHGPLSAAAASERYLVLIVMDGFRADYATLDPMRNLRALMARGMSYDNAWVGHLESETPTGHATIGTGVYPRKHGIIGFGWRDVRSEQFTWMPTDLTQIRAGGLAETMARHGAPTISDLIHRRNRGDVVVSLSGEKYYASATMGAGADFIFYGKDDGNGVFRPVVVSASETLNPARYASVKGQADFASQDSFAADLAIQMVRNYRPRALLVNLPDTDIAGHYYGGMIDPHDMTPIVHSGDAAVGRIVEEYRRQGLLERTIFVVTADHGMAASRHIVPIHSMYRTIAHTTTGTLDEELRITMGSVWLKHDRENRQLARGLAAQKYPNVEGALFKVRSGSGWTFVPDGATGGKIPDEVLHTYIHLADTEACPSGPEVVLPYAEDTMGITVPGRKHWGEHGGFSWGTQHIPLVVAGPGVRHGVSHFPAKLVDIAPTVERLLGLSIPAQVDGIVLADSVADSSLAERAVQQRLDSQRSSYVQALRAYSAMQSRT